MGPYVRTRTQDNSRPFVTRHVYSEVASRDFVFSQVIFFTVKGRNRAGSSRNESDQSRRGTQISFPLVESRSYENFGLATFSILQTDSSINFFSSMKIKTGAIDSPPIQHLRLSGSGKLVLVPIRQYSHSSIEQPARFPAFTGQTLARKKPNSVCSFNKIVPHNKRPQY